MKFVVTGPEFAKKYTQKIHAAAPVEVCVISYGYLQLRFHLYLHD